MYNQKIANRIVETLKAGYEGGVDAMLQLYPRPYIDMVDRNDELCLIAFSLAITEQMPDGPNKRNVAELQETMETLIKKVENFILTGEDAGVELGAYPSMILRDLIFMDRRYRGLDRDKSNELRKMEESLDSTVEEFSEKFSDVAPKLTKAVKKAQRLSKKGQLREALDLLREEAARFGLKLPED